MKKGHLSRNIFLIIFSSTILLFLLMSFYIISLDRKSISQQNNQEIKSLNKQISLQLNSFILKQQLMLETFIDTNLTSLHNQTNTGQILNSFVENISSINDIVLIDSFGNQKEESIRGGNERSFVPPQRIIWFLHPQKFP